MKRRTLLGSFSVLVMVLVTMAALSALPTPSQFELEGNATVEATADWANTVVNGNTGGALATSFIVDGSGNKTIFTGGGSKDINDMTQWKWKDELGGLPDKDNITNAYAAAYANDAGDLTIYFGADRFATAGDAELGFWFFHQRVQAIGGIFVGSDGVTPATHTLGDVFVLVNFSNGGGTATAQVYQWNGSGLTLVDTVTNAKCGSNSDPNVCAITNPGDSPAPWAYTPKSGTPGTFPAVSFFEGGINISAFIQTSVGGCFSSFMAETRASTSLTATQKDFALGEFDTCKLTIAKDCPTVTYDATTNLLNYTSNITVKNEGFGTVFDLTVVDTPTPPGQAATFTQGTLAKNTTATFTHTFSYTPSLTSPNPPSNTATATAAITPGGLQIVDAGTATATCPSVSFDASLTITKTCSSSIEVLNSKLVVAVDVAGTVCNIPPAPGPGAPFPEAIGSVSVSDSPAFEGGTVSLGTLAVNECKPYAAKYYPNVLTVVGGNPSSVPGDQTFSDTAAATGTGVVTGAAKANTATANCPLCPPHQ
jgi:hypothetical protein